MLQVDQGWGPQWTCFQPLCPLPWGKPLPPRPSAAEAQAFPGTELMCLRLLSEGYCPPPFLEYKTFRAGTSFSGTDWLAQVKTCQRLSLMKRLGEFRDVPSEGPASSIWAGSRSSGPGPDANLCATGLQLRHFPSLGLPFTISSPMSRPVRTLHQNLCSLIWSHQLPHPSFIHLHACLHKASWSI